MNRQEVVSVRRGFGGIVALWRPATTLTTLPVSIVIRATRTHKRITHRRLNKRSRDLILWLDFFLRLTIFYG